MVEEMINMQNDNALISLAYIKENDNPLEVLCNYILICLLKSYNHILRYDELTKEMEKNFGLKMSVHMLNMCCNILKNQHKISKLPGGAGFELIDFTFDINSFETRKKFLQNIEMLIINDLIEFVKDFNITWSYEQAKINLTDFLLFQGNAAYIFTNDSIKNFDNKKSVSPEWYVGKYVNNLINTGNDLKSYLINIINGLMIYIGVYETKDYNQNHNQMFYGTKFFFDTKLILRLMGYSWKLEVDAAKELYDLIKSYKGYIYVFEHTVGEVEFALGTAEDCIKNQQVIQDLELRVGVETKGRDDFNLKIDKSSVRNIIEQELKIKIHTDINWNNEKNQKHNIDTHKMVEYIVKRHPNWKHRAVENDVDIINYINILRKGDYTKKYGGSKKLPVFITSNSSLVYDIRYYIDSIENKDKNIANWNYDALPIITDYMLMCRLWVPKANIKSNIPALTLARNAYSAQQIDYNYFAKLKQTAQKLKADRNIDLINISTIEKEKLDEILVRNKSGDIDDISEELLASSADELIKLETLNLRNQNEQLQKETQDKTLIIKQNKEVLVKSIAERYKNKIGMKKILIYLAEIYWLIGTILFGIFSLLLSFLKGFTTLPYCGGIYAILFIILKVSEKIFNKGKLGDFLISRTVEYVWKIYAGKIEKSLLESEIPYKREILVTCIEINPLLKKYEQYCEIS